MITAPHGDTQDRREEVHEITKSTQNFNLFN